jgi:hypothetical protein
VNTKRVNSAAGVILAALEQNRTPAGIALALESAGLLMTPETAADMASLSAEAVRVAEESVTELKREHAENARLRERIAELEKAAEEIRYLHKDSPMGPCPVCIDADAMVRGDDPTLPYPCPTARLAGAKDCDPQSGDALTRLLAPTQALRVGEPGACTECGDGPSKWCAGCAKCSCEPKHDTGCAYAGALQ